jgi:hypothetical protein
VTNEDQKLVEKFISDNKIAYPIVIEKSGKSKDALKVTGIPHSFLVDSKGNIVWEGHPASLPNAEIEKALQGAHVPGMKLPAGLKSVEKTLEKGDYGKAYETVKGLMAGKLDDESTKAGQELLNQLEGDAKDLLAAATKHVEAKEYFEANGQLERLQKQYAGVPGAEGADAKLKELQADAEAKKSIKASELLAKAQELDQAKDFDKAYASYHSIAKGYSGTKPAEAAAARMTEIEQKGLLGYEAHCPACQKEGHACDKHKKKPPGK